VDGTETQVRRPRANRCGRRAFVSGKKRQNTIKVTTVCDSQGRTLWAGAVRPGRMHDQTAIKTEGIEDLLRRHHDVHAKVDAGYRGLAKAFGDQVHAPPPEPAKAASPEELAAWHRARTQQSSQRICVEHANAEHKQWRALQRWIGRREYYAQNHRPSPGWSPTGRPAADYHPTETGQASTSQPQSRTKSLGCGLVGRRYRTAPPIGPIGRFRLAPTSDRCRQRTMRGSLTALCHTGGTKSRWMRGSMP
jgi:DDE superfamily endonuclease